MGRFSLFRLLRKNNNLSYRRSPAFEQSVVAKVMMVIGGGFMVVYLLMFGIMFSIMANEEEQPALIFVILPFLLLLDFGMRFMAQQTPAMLAKPYMLLPMPRKAVVDTFLVTALVSPWNWLWLALFLPYFIITLCGGASLWAALCVFLGGMLLVMANSQWYLIVRTLIARSLLWWLLPAAFYVVYFVPMLMDDQWKVFSSVADFIGEHGGSLWGLLFCMAFLGLMFYINRNMQYRFVYEEISREEKAPAALGKVSSFAFLERFGQTGEYLKLEVKSIMRNKAIRSRVFMSLGLVVVLSGLITFTDIYDGLMMLNFWCYYCFGIYGMTALVKIMGPEGNYIDLLMVHRENTLLLLKAKYYLHCAILVVPFLLMLPAVIGGKFSWLMMLAYMLLSSGVLYLVLFQLAVYNKQTLPLDKQITGKGNVENGLQLILELGAMFLPIGLVAVLLILFDETTAYLMLILIGLVGTLLHPLWLRNVYRRMMLRKYENLEGFHATR